AVVGGRALAAMDERRVERVVAREVCRRARAGKAVAALVRAAQAAIRFYAAAEEVVLVERIARDVANAGDRDAAGRQHAAVRAARVMRIARRTAAVVVANLSAEAAHARGAFGAVVVAGRARRAVETRATFVLRAVGRAADVAQRRAVFDPRALLARVA